MYETTKSRAICLVVDEIGNPPASCERTRAPQQRLHE